VWIRHRQGEVTVEVTRPDGGSVKVSAANVRGMTPAQLRAQVDQLSRVLEAGRGDGADESDPGPRA
jgi:Effector Associated Constant Component 1